MRRSVRDSAMKVQKVLKLERNNKVEVFDMEREEKSQKWLTSNKVVQKQ